MKPVNRTTAPPPKGRQWCTGWRLYASVGVLLAVLLILLAGTLLSSSSLFFEALDPSTPSGAVLRKGCFNRQDRAIVKARYDSLQTDVQKCAMSNHLFGAESVTRCVQGLGFTFQCSMCWAELTTCSVRHCTWDCVNPWSTRCKRCGHTKCFPGLLQCSGLEEGFLPPP